jgi:hypothetical protein
MAKMKKPPTKALIGALSDGIRKKPPAPNSKLSIALAAMAA